MRWVTSRLNNIVKCTRRREDREGVEKHPVLSTILKDSVYKTHIECTKDLVKSLTKLMGCFQKRKKCLLFVD